MSFLSYLGLDDVAEGIREFTDGFDELKQEILSSVIGPGEELKNTVGDIVESVKTQVGDTTSAISDSATNAVDGVKNSIGINTDINK